MTTNTIYSAYDSFARVMNEDWGTEDSEAVLPDVEALFLKHLPQQSSILDLCCGTGHLARKLQDKGYQVTGIDGSSELLRYARDNAPQSKFIVDDARYFKLPASFNGVISTNYGLNHITKLEELTWVFQNVYTTLLSNGLFVFDLRLDKFYKKDNWNNSLIGNVQDEYAWALKRIYNPEEKIGNIYITIFELTNNNWKRSDLTWSVKGYDLEEVIFALQTVGFKNINYYNQEDISAHTKEANILYFVCHK
ncbi:Methyltransferase type 11 [Stanieria cyanosphaera PCC 7437]|uniref:Methyltransferase type 11 n=1 Tax=Stanieria cyanosphaera (strain ATCC 29371 / PCC 7437) TaxID=111780 RepID=K9XWZ5_STAC7|nr:class I SAM-dependent methyltransferase [Stanieria cyanosphaera]AFZ36192.1 Methyltransferase type 11 [Stanieria cyanosphaera PCC 7437]